MAIDNKNKRLSAINVSLPWRGMYPVPDGSLDNGDRQTIVGLYRGLENAFISISSAAIAYTGKSFTSQMPITISIEDASVVYEGNPFISQMPITLDIGDASIQYQAKSLTVSEVFNISKTSILYAGKSFLSNVSMLLAPGSMAYLAKALGIGISVSIKKGLIRYTVGGITIISSLKRRLSKIWPYIIRRRKESKHVV